MHQFSPDPGLCYTNTSIACFAHDHKSFAMIFKMNHFSCCYFDRKTKIKNKMWTCLQRRVALVISAPTFSLSQ